MATNDINLFLDDDGIERMRKLNNKLGMVAFNIAFMIAPMDTGNLRRSITMPKNTPTMINIRYNSLIANYSYFLENGFGYVKKYKGFISVDTKNAIVEAIVNYAETGFLPPFSHIPRIELGSTKSVFSKERTILQSVNSNSRKISADVRKQISMIREQEYAKSKGVKLNTSIRGTQVESTRNFARGSNKGLSELRRAYRNNRES